MGRGGAPSASATGPGSSRSTGRSIGPVPWAADGTAPRGTIHLGGTLDEIAAAEAEVAAGRHPERPYVLFVQTRHGTPRAPAGKTTGWAYCHVPAGSTVDMTERIEAQVERFAPGFRDRILARATHGPAAMEAHDENYVGGDINGGVQDIRQLIFRPWPSLDPYRVGCRAVPVFVVDAAGRWRPRHERDAGRALGAQARAVLTGRGGASRPPSSLRGPPSSGPPSPGSTASPRRPHAAES